VKQYVIECFLEVFVGVIFVTDDLGKTIEGSEFKPMLVLFQTS
jgi:hypothetical protein